MARKPGRPRKKPTPQVTPGPPEPPPRTYENIAKRVLAAIEEFNAAFQEAYDFSEMTVQAHMTDLENEKPPLQVRQCRIFKLTDIVPDETWGWTVVRDPSPEQEREIEKIKMKMKVRQAKAPE